MAEFGGKVTVKKTQNTLIPLPGTGPTGPMSSKRNLLSRRVIFIIVLILAWPGRGVSQIHPPSVSAARLAAARSLVREALEEAKALRTDQERGALRNLARVQAKTGDITGAQQTLATVPDLPDKQNTDFAIQEIAIAQAVAGDMLPALRTVSTLPSGGPRVRALKAIAQVQASRGDIAGALQTAGSVKEDWVGSSMLLAVAQAQAEAGDIAGAIKTARTIPRNRDDFELESFIAMAHARNGNLAEALSTARAIQSSNRLFLYVSLAAYQARAGDMAGALQMAEEIPEDPGSGLRELAFYGIVLGQVSTGDLAGARSTVARIKAPSVQADAIAVILGMQARKGDVVGSLGAAQALPDAQAREVALASVAAAQARTGDVASAIRTATGITDSEQQTSALAKVAEIQADRGDGNGAWTTASMISDTAMRDLAEEKVALIVARAGDPARLITIGRRKPTAYLRVIALCQSAEDILKNAADTAGIHNIFPPELRP